MGKNIFKLLADKSIDDQIIIDRENRWKEVLQTRKFGYNEN
jgi:hypothetical protein